MAKSGSITISQGSFNTSALTSVITVTGKITTSGESYRGTHRTGTYTIYKDGTSIKTGSFTSGAPANSTTTLFTTTVTITHNSSTGAGGSITASYNYDSGWCTGSGSLSTTPFRFVSYNANGGSGAPGKQTVVSGSKLTLSSTKPTRTGYTFSKWNTNSSGTGTNYSGGTSYGINSNLTLYAIWTINNYYLDINGNLDGTDVGNISGYGTCDVNVGGSLKSDNCSDYYVAHPYGSTYSITDIKATTGHTYQGVASGAVSGTIGTSGVSVRLKFTTDTYTISYDANGGSGAPGNQTKTYGVALILSSTIPTRTNCKFLGWSTSSTATAATYSAGASFTTNAATKLYAVWKLSGYNISFNANGGSGAPATVFKTHGVDLTLPTTVPTRTAYTFKGWSTSSTATTETYQAGGTFSTDETTTLYAVWTAWSHTVKYDANGGSGAPANQTKTAASNLTLSSTKPTRAGYAFSGWCTTADGTGTRYTPGGIYTHNQNGGTVTLYAMWTNSNILIYDTGTLEAALFAEKNASSTAVVALLSSGEVDTVKMVEK